MVIGTMLGDASLSLKDTHPRYRAAHGLPQKDYCALKELIIRNLVRTPMRVTTNAGYGDFTARFDTLTSPEFDFLIPLCFREVNGKLKKTVTPEWVAQLTWEAVAWWFMDDGCRQATALQISTHSFSKEEVDLLADWLTRQGCPAHAHKTRKGKTKTYYILKIPTASVPVFEQHVRPFILPMMAYKLDGTGPSGTALSCTFCGREFEGNGRNSGGRAKAPCCGRVKCRKAAKQAVSSRYGAKLGQREIYRRAKTRLLGKSPEEQHAEKVRARKRLLERESDPAHKAAKLAKKRQWRLKRKVMGLPRM